MPFCTICGTEYQIGQQHCIKCGSPLPQLDSRERGPRANQQRAAQAPRPASRLRRLAASTVDVLACAILFYLAFQRGRRSVLGSRAGCLLVAALIAAAIGYLLIRDSFAGKSVGKALLGLTVVNLDRRARAGLRDSFLRNVVFLPVVTFLPALASILTGRLQHLGDRLAGTAVVDDRALRQILN